jgi:membrane-associated phospholipid phosphatase
LLLVSFAVVVGAAIAAGELLALVERPDGSTAFDSSITSWVVDHRTDVLTTLARWFSTIGSQKVLVPVTAVVTVVLIARRRFLSAAVLVAMWWGALGLYSLAKHFVHRLRPPTDIWLTKVGATSFPSGHATQSLATFVALVLAGAALSTKVRRATWAIAVAIALAAAVSWSRVYLGVHWTTDVAAGLLFAGTWVAVVAWLARSVRLWDSVAAARRSRSEEAMSLEAMQPGPMAVTMRLGEDKSGYGWVVFAGIMLTLAGTVNIIDGIAAVGGSHFFTRRANYIIGDLTSLGWVLIVLGAGQVLAGFGVLAKNPLARWFGVTVAALNGVAQLLFLPAYPLWSLAVFTLDILVMHGLIVYGGRTMRPA